MQQILHKKLTRLSQLEVLRMKENQRRFMTLLGQLPARLTAEQTGWVLNCQSHGIPALVTERLLKPLGNPSANGTKYFATTDLVETAKDRAWLVKMTMAINHTLAKAEREKMPFCQWFTERALLSAGFIWRAGRKMPH